MQADSIQMQTFVSNENINESIIEAQEANQENNKFCKRAITIINNSSTKGFVIGSFAGALIGVPIAFAKGFASSYTDINESAAITIALTTYFAGGLVGAYYKPMFSSCKQIIARNHCNCKHSSNEPIDL